MISLANPWITLQADPETGRYSLLPHASGWPAIRAARLGVRYELLSSSFRGLTDAWPVDSQQSARITLPGVGLAEQVELLTLPDGQGMRYRLRMAVPERLPFALIQLELHNTSELPVRLLQFDLLETGAQPGTGRLELAPGTDPQRLRFYSNGWQSWSYTGGYDRTRSMPSSRLVQFNGPMVFNPGTPNTVTRGYFTSDFFGALIDPQQQAGLLAGFLSQQQQFGSVECYLDATPTLRMWANADRVLVEPGGSLATDWAVLAALPLDQPDPLASYLDAVAGFHGVEQPAASPTGWCSWYHYFTRVTGADVQANLEMLAQTAGRLPLELVQIDDGWEAQVGDWLDFKPTFPAGVAPLAQAIRASGKIPGLWLAPFIVHPRSKLAHEHPDWLLRDERRRRVNAGFGWNAFNCALDLTHPAAFDYTQEVIRTAVQDWGFPYLKLDFLYAGALPGVRHDPTLTRAQVLRKAMQAVRDTAGPDAFLLGCGLPLGSAIGLVQAMRIGEDVSEGWLPRLYGLQAPFKGEWHVPSVRNAIHNTLTRAPLHHRWWVNDPDCLLARLTTRLTLAEVRSLAAVITLTGGSLLVSDDLPALPQERRALLERLLPPIGERAEVLDLFEPGTPARLRLDLDGPAERWHVLAGFNWTASDHPWEFQPGDFNLPEGDYWVTSFWDGQVTYLPAGAQLTSSLPPHGSSVLAVQPAQPGQPHYLGSSLHISQGRELAGWQPEPDGLTFTLALPRQAEGLVWLALPRPPQSIRQDGQPLDWQPEANGVVRLAVAFDRSATLHVDY